MFNLCTEFTVSGTFSVSSVSCVVLFYTFILNIFVTSESIYIVIMTEKKTCLDYVHLAGYYSFSSAICVVLQWISS